jgi:hypothetical protein
VTVVARRRLAWRGTRRSLQFMIGLALLAIAATGTPDAIRGPVHDGTHGGRSGWAAGGTGMVSMAVDVSATGVRYGLARRSSGDIAARARVTDADIAVHGAPPAAPTAAGSARPDGAPRAGDRVADPAAGPRAPPARAA